MQLHRQLNSQIRRGRGSLVASLVLFLVVMITGLAFRLGAVPLYAHPDLSTFRDLANSVHQYGLFDIYSRSEHTNHPPIEIVSIWLPAEIFRSNGGDMETDAAPGQLAALKAISIFFDMATVILAYGLIFRLAGPFWALLPATALALNPAVMMDSSVWGETDAIFTFFLVLSVAALYFRRNKTVWLAWSLSVLSKIQALPLLPLLVAATLVPRTSTSQENVSRLGTRLTWRRLRAGLVVSVVVIAAVMLPFFIGSGARAGQAFNQDQNELPFLTINTYNFWWWQTNGAGNSAVDYNGSASDMQNMPGTPVTYRVAGWILFGALVVLIVAKTIASPRGRNEYLLAGMLYVGFFMLLTQMHERNLYPAIALFAISTVGWDRHDRPQVDWRGVILFVGFSLTFTFNLAVTSSIAPPQLVTLMTFIFPGRQDDVARVNVILLIATVVVLFLPERFKMPSPEHVSSLYTAARPHEQKT